MDEYKIILLKLIKQSQFGDGKEFPIENCDWDEVYSEAVSQSLVGIIAPEIPLSVRKRDERWQNNQMQLFAYNVRYFYAEEELTKLLDDAKIPFVILKGTSAAVYYKNPERRMMGDIDFLVAQNEYERALDLLSNNGYIRESEPHTLRHVGFRKNGISFELHHHFSHDDLDIEKYLIEGLKKRVYSSVENIHFPMLPQLPNGLVLLDHMRSHLKSGLGFRQIIDWMMFVESELSDEFWNNEFSTVVRTLGLEKFAKVTTRMCQLHLGLQKSITWCNDVDEELCDNLLAMIFEFGNFGRKKGSGNSVETVRSQIKKYGLFSWLQIAGEHNWKVYSKHQWLKPLCWLYQFFRYATQGFKSGRSYDQISDDIKKGNNRYEFLEKLGVVKKV